MSESRTHTEPDNSILEKEAVKSEGQSSHFSGHFSLRHSGRLPNGVVFVTYRITQVPLREELIAHRAVTAPQVWVSYRRRPL